MPQSESLHSGEHRLLHDERDRDPDAREKKTSKSSKAKDLSHVPCRFFRVGACTAGASCPFSHQAAEPGQQKGICQWYLKGSCKFGHKCALAHILPGQPLSMDRKNKRAEQALAQGKTPSNTSGRDRTDRENKRHSGHERREANGQKHAEPANAPSRQPMSSRPPMTIGKAPPTVSATGSVPVLQDSDFRKSEDNARRPVGITSFAAAVASSSATQSGSAPSHDEITTPTSSPPGIPNTPPLGAADKPKTPATVKPIVTPATSLEAEADRKPSPLPQSRPVHHRGNPSSDLGFGPIGSPPGAAGASPLHAYSPPSNGLATGRSRLSVQGFAAAATSPPATKFEFDPAAPGGFGSSAFMQGSPSSFTPYGPGGSVPTRTHLEHASSFGDPMAAHNSHGLWGNNTHRGSLPATSLLGGIPDSQDDDLEEFLPSSLNELLTPGERSRRMSRTSARPSLSDMQMRSAQSVPAASLLHNVRGLWEDGGAEKRGGVAFAPDAWIKDDMVGTPGEPSSSFLGTSNASAAFLSGHLRRTDDALLDSALSSSFDMNHQLQAPSNMRSARPDAGVPSSLFGQSSSPRTSFLPNDSSYYGLHPHQHNPRPFADQTHRANPSHLALSPSSRALRSHEPGQSLPQGLAAGLSRLHLIPATSPISPPLPSGGSPHSHFQQQQLDWSASQSVGKPGLSGVDVLQGLPTILSPPRSSVLSTSPAIGGVAPSKAAPATIRRPWLAHSTSSPLSRAGAGDDDGLFAMDEET